MTSLMSPAERALEIGRSVVAVGEPAFWESKHVISHVEAKDAAQRLINSHFHNEDRARITIPADTERDDDLVILSYIAQQERAAHHVAEAVNEMPDNATLRAAAAERDEALHWYNSTSVECSQLRAEIAALKLRIAELDKADARHAEDQAALAQANLKLTRLQDSRHEWTEETRAACKAFEQQYDVEVVSFEHHCEIAHMLQGFEAALAQAKKINSDLKRKLAEAISAAEDFSTVIHDIEADEYELHAREDRAWARATQRLENLRASIAKSEGKP